MKKSKKLISIILSLTFIISSLCALPFGAFAADLTTGNCGQCVTYSFDAQTGTLSVIGNGAMTDFEESASPFYNNSSIITVSFDNGVTAIGKNAFRGCLEITTIYIPKTVTKINANAFISSGKITDIYYAGSKEDWKKITIGSRNDFIRNTTPHYNYIPPCAVHTPGEAVKENVIPSTCLAEGTYDEVVYCTVCKAELSRDSKTSAIGDHSPAEAVKENEIPASCTVDGSYDEVVYCSVCGEELSREAKTDKADHTPAEGVRENISGAICTEGGSYDYVEYCSVCGEELFRETQNVGALGHVPAEAVRESFVESTCTERGIYDEVVYCSVCGEELSRVTKQFPLAEHTYETETKEPTCTELGYTTYTCTVCGHTAKSNYVLATGHKEEYDKAIAATCEKEGKTAGSHCSKCGKVSVAQRTVSPKGHSEETVTGTPATFKKAGKTDGKKCSVCGKVLVAQKSIAKLKAPSLSKVTAGKKQFKASWKSVKSIDGYQIQYSTDKKFKKNNKTVTVKGYKSTSKTVKSLKAKKKYYVRIRGYIKIDGKTQYSDWSKSKTVTTKK